MIENTKNLKVFSIIHIISTFKFQNDYDEENRFETYMVIKDIKQKCTFSKCQTELQKIVF